MGPEIALGRGRGEGEGDAHVIVLLEFPALACSSTSTSFFLSLPTSKILRFIVYECALCLSLLSHAKEDRNRDE
jgi:hypothetical protein